MQHNITSSNSSIAGDNHSVSSQDSWITVWKVGSPFIIIFGTFGNIMVFLVLQDRSVTHPSMAVYLRLLAVSDLINIFDSVILRWIRFQFGFYMKVGDVVVRKSCNENYDDEVTTTVFKVWFWINTMTSSCLPFVILLVDDVILIRRVVTSTREARDHLAVGSIQQVKVREKKAVSMTSDREEEEEKKKMVIKENYLITILRACVFSLGHRSVQLHVVLSALRVTAAMLFRFYTDMDFVYGPFRDFRNTENAEYLRTNPRAVRVQRRAAVRRRVNAEFLCGCEKSNDSRDLDNEVYSGCIVEDGDYSFLEALDPNSQIPVQLEEIPWSLVAQATYIPWCCTEPYTCYPQHLACLFGQKDLATMMLVQKAADVHARDSRHNTTLMLAAASGCARTMVALLLLMCKDEDDRKKLVTAQNKDGLTALHFAALSDDPQVVELLLGVGADVNAGQFTTLQNRRFALTPLHFALVRDTRTAATIARILVKSGADLDLEAATADSRAPCGKFFRECSCGFCFCVDIDPLPRLLLPSNGAWYDGEINSVGTALHLAVKRRIDLSDILSEKQHRLLLNVPDGLGYLPLHTAVNNLDQKAIKILLSLGADVNAKVTKNCPQQGRTALHILFSFQLDFPPFDCICCSNTLKPSHRLNSCAPPLLQLPSVNVDARDGEGKTPLHVACQFGHYAFIEQLVTLGADVLVEDNEGRMPLYFAARPAGSEVRGKVVDVLLRCGAVLSCLNQPYHLSPVKEFDQFLDVAILLKLCRLGAITGIHQNRMLQTIDLTMSLPTAFMHHLYGKVVFAAIAAYRQERLHPLSLYAQSIICVSRSIKAGSPQSRREAFMSLELDHFTLATMQDLCLM
ncbi:hypothetical protein C0Q70_21099 [Pomacea canaliculata]|uniref:Uncharacterized protein n=1 Tax=Pomacea canaliculata TaxID=400727 RepID=A0A2T7NBL1_POMCA|nr:hypothetical protein C0Q70_21099 [Pomacea canaliculata]